MHLRCLSVAVLVLAAAVPASGQKKQAATWTFRDVTAEVVDKNPPGVGPMFDYAFVDLNDDGCLDIVVNNHHRSKPSPVWLGTRERTFRFWRNMPKTNVPIAGFWVGEVDQNGDGKTDLVYTGNEGGVIVSINTSPAGTREPAYRTVPIKHSSALVSFVDLEGDGDLEMLARPGRIYDKTLTKPIQTGVQYGLWTASDFNNDGRPDLFAPGARRRRRSWSGPRKLWKNVEGKLEEIGADSDLVTGAIGGIARTGDFNNDGNMDLYIFGSRPPEVKDTKSARTVFAMRLFLGDGNFGFTDVSEKAGIAASKQKPGYSQVYLADLNNDTFVDIVNEGNYGTRCWRNNGDGTFTEFPKKALPWTITSHMRFDDYDMDGRLDVVTAAAGAPWKDRKTSIRVFRNEIDNGNHWLKMQLRQPDGNTMAIGASVTVYKSGTQTILGKQICLTDAMSYSPRLHFGLGKHERVDVEVVFPSGRKRVRFKDIAANRYVVLRPDGSVKDVQ